MNDHSSITILTAVDDRYVVPLAVMLRSLCSSLAVGSLVDVRLMTTGLNKASRRGLESALAGLPMTLQIVTVDRILLEGLKIDGHISSDTYLRLYAPDYLPDVDKILYLDSDLLVRHSLHEIYHTDFAGAHVLAVPHISRRSAFFGAERGVPSYSQLGIAASTRTFNAGVMLMALERWRETKTTSAIVEYLRRYREKVLWWDQDGLNAVLHAKWKSLPAKWNVMTSHFAEFRSWDDSLLDRDTFEAVYGNPGIIHFSTGRKPWHGNYQGPYKELWKMAFEEISHHFDLDFSTFGGVTR